MKEEVAAAVVFVKRLLKRNKSMGDENLQTFCDHLTKVLVEKFQNHWHLEKPTKGQAFRSVHVDENGPADPVLQCAAKVSKMRYSDLNLPPEFTLWIDPREVSCRFGERGSPCILATFRDDKHENKASTINIEYLLDEHNQRRAANISRFQQATSSRATQQKTAEKSVYKYYRSSPQNSPSKLVTRPCQYKSNYPASLKSDKFHWVKEGSGNPAVVQA